MSISCSTEVAATKCHLIFRSAQFVKAGDLWTKESASLQGRQPAEEIQLMTDHRVHAGDAQEDQVTAAIEKYTAPIPSSAYLGLALASIAASVTLQLTQKEKANAALFVGQWVAPFLLLGIYNKLVKQHGSDAQTH
jgi:hypothetical protein